MKPVICQAWRPKKPTGRSRPGHTWPVHFSLDGPGTMGERQANRSSIEQPRGSRLAAGGARLGTALRPRLLSGGRSPPIGPRAFSSPAGKRNGKEMGRTWQGTAAPTEEERTKTHSFLSRTPRRGVVWTGRLACGCTSQPPPGTPPPPLRW